MTSKQSGFVSRRNRALAQRATALAGSLLLNLGLLAGVVIAMRGPDILPSGIHRALVTVTITPVPRKTAPPPPQRTPHATEKPGLLPPRPAPEESTAPLPLARRGTTPQTAAAPLPQPDVLPAPDAMPPAPRPQPSQTAPSAGRVDAYRQQIWQRILAARPRRASGTGTATIRFTIDRNGALVSAEIAGSTGQFLLDRLALQAVRKAAPFPAPPAGMDEAGLSFTVPVSFHR